MKILFNNILFKHNQRQLLFDEGTLGQSNIKDNDMIEVIQLSPDD